MTNAEGALPSVNSGTHVKYFARGKEVYDQYYGYLICISTQHVPAFKHASKLIMIEVGRPNTFICSPVPSKAEWDFVQHAHEFLLHFSFPVGIGEQGVEKWADIVVSDIMTQGRIGATLLCQQIEMQHESMMVARHLESGKPIEEYKNPWNKIILNQILMKYGIHRGS